MDQFARQNKLAKPTYQEVPSAQIPVPTSAEGHQVKVIAGSWQETTGHCIARTLNLYLDLQLQNETPLFVPIPAGHNAFVYVYRANLLVAGQTIAPRRMAILNNDTQANGVLLQGHAGRSAAAGVIRPTVERTDCSMGAICHEYPRRDRASDQ